MQQKSHQLLMQKTLILITKTKKEKILKFLKNAETIKTTRQEIKPWLVKTQLQTAAHIKNIEITQINLQHSLEPSLTLLLNSKY